VGLDYNCVVSHTEQLQLMRLIQIIRKKSHHYTTERELIVTNVTSELSLQKHVYAYLFMGYFGTLLAPHYSTQSIAQVKNDRRYNSAYRISIHVTHKSNFVPVTSSSGDSALTH